MRDELTPVYHGRTTDDAQRLADLLGQAGVESFIQMAQSPLYGMRSGPTSNTVYVRRPVMGIVKEVVRTFEQERPGLSHDERQAEQTGLELDVPDRPSDDAYVEGVQETTEEASRDRKGPDSPELQAVDEGLDESQIHSMDVDRPLAHPAEVEDEEYQEQPIDELDIEILEGEHRETAEQEAGRRKRSGR